MHNGKANIGIWGIKLSFSNSDYSLSKLYYMGTKKKGLSEMGFILSVNNIIYKAE